MASMTSTTASMASPTAMPGMMDSSNMNGMNFSSNNYATSLYSSAWMPTTPAGYAGSWLFLFFLAITWRGLVLGLSRFDKRCVRKHEAHTILYDGGKQQTTRANTVGVWRWSVNLPRAALATVNQAIAYLLMIAVMTMNTGFFFAVVVGYFFGELVFGRIHGVSAK